MKKILGMVNVGGAILFPRLVSAQWVPGDLALFGLPGGAVSSIVANVMYWLVMILGVVAVIGFVISGILYLTAAGNEDQAKQAKRAMTYSIIGVIVGLLGLIVLRAAFRLLKGVSF